MRLLVQAVAGFAAAAVVFFACVFFVVFLQLAEGSGIGCRPAECGPIAEWTSDHNWVVTGGAAILALAAAALVAVALRRR